MDPLDGIRLEIDDIDTRLARLFEERMDKVAELWEYKRSQGLPILDAARERRVLERTSACVRNPGLRPLHREFQRELMRLGRSLQEGLSDPEGTLRVRADGADYPVHIGSGILSRACDLLHPDGKTLIVTDEGVPEAYLDTICKLFPESPVVLLDQGEAGKSFDLAELIISKLLEGGFTRSDCILALGGGKVCDLAGFAAACYMRGIRWYAIPTTLLAQLDASVGGKTAVNFGGIKNAAGAFHHPSGVLVDTALTQTLPPRLLHEGLAELIKIAAVCDSDLFQRLEAAPAEIPQDLLESFVREAVRLKAEVVSADPRDLGVRAALNFGHTIGHAVEALSHGALLHGECVAIGMMYTSSGQARERIEAMLRRWTLPTEDSFTPKELLQAAIHDKKASQGGVRMVLVQSPGECRFELADQDKLLTIIEKRKNEE